MKSIKKMLIASLLLCIIILSVVGCSNKKTIVATINGVSVSEQLYRINLWSNQRGLEAAYENFWNMDNILGKSPEEFLKEKTLESTAYCIVVQEKAKELGIKTKEEKAKIKEKAKADMKNYAEFAKKYNIKRKDYEAYYTFAAQKEKVMALLAENYEPNETEVAAQIEQMKAEGDFRDEGTIIHILFATINELGEQIPTDKKEEVYEKAQTILKEALAGEDMSTLASRYSDDPSVSENLGEYTFVRGDGLGEGIDAIVFEKAQVGSVYPELIETDMGYEIIKVVDRKLETEDEWRARAILKIKEQYAKNELAEMTSFADIQTTEVYDAIEVGPATETQVE
ncbi:MAG: hypothetical protein E7231_12145 [Cellulosilyticum sp.]|nr:hypothetical protein [Cellulosilyticum sp.]